MAHRYIAKIVHAYAGCIITLLATPQNVIVVESNTMLTYGIHKTFSKKSRLLRFLPLFLTTRLYSGNQNGILPRPIVITFKLRP